MSSILSIESMTGYGEARAVIAGITLVCRLKSLNHRFLDVKVRLPRPDWPGLDMAIRKHLSQTFTRGAVELTVSAETESANAAVSVNTELAKEYWEASQTLLKKLKSKKVAAPTALTIDGLFRLPGVISTQSHAGLSEAQLATLDEATVVKKLIEPALGKLKAARLLEGQKLLKHFEQLLAQMNEHLAAVKKLEEPEKERARQLISERAHETIKVLSSLGAQTDEFSSRVREEAVFWIERRDYEEERVRLEMHLKNFKVLLTDREGVSGRKLEFLQQELLREVNTLGTKAQSSSITSHTIEMKTILEKIKEQLANVA